MRVRGELATGMVCWIQVRAKLFQLLNIKYKTFDLHFPLEVFSFKVMKLYIYTYVDVDMRV